MKSSQKCFLGYYRPSHKLIAISGSRDLLVNYLVNHRGFQQHEYVIEKEYLSDTALVLEYENYVITNYNDYYIPNIDQRIIELHSHTIDQELIATIEQLKHIASLSVNIKKIPDQDIQQMISTIKILVNMTNKPKILSKLNRQSQINHSILYCNIEEYFCQVRQYMEITESNTRYYNALVEY